MCSCASSLLTLRISLHRNKVAPIEEVKAAIAAFPGAVLEDDVANQVYPQAANAVGKRETFVGRIRKDLDVENGIHMWVVSDNLLKGAAWNSVQIAETLHERGLVHQQKSLNSNSNNNSSQFLLEAGLWYI